MTIWFEDEIGISKCCVPRNNEETARKYFNKYYRYKIVGVSKQNNVKTI